MSVNCLAAMLQDTPATYFYTHTINETMHPGIKQLMDLSFKMKDELRNIFYSDIDAMRLEEYRKTLDQATCVQSVQTWQRTLEILLKYITESHEMPLGKVSMYFGRKENQESSGKISGILSHFHLILWILSNKENCDAERQIEE